MGQSESSVENSGSNLKSLNDKNISQTKKKENNDSYFKYVDVKDHIRPIYVDKSKDPIKENNPNYDELNYDLEINALLSEIDENTKLNGGRDNDNENDENSDDFLNKNFHNQNTDGEEYSIDSDDIQGEDDQERGTFHHEIKSESSEQKFSIFSSEVHPVSIRGRPLVDETLIFIDLSASANQCPVYKIYWFISMDICSQDIFDASPCCEGNYFKITSDIVGKYVKVEGIRRVENQLFKNNERIINGGIFDPHVYKAKYIDLGLSVDYVDVKSTFIIGPILISNNLATQMLNDLQKGFSISSIILKDHILTENDSTRKISNSHDIKGLLNITFSHLDILLDSQDTVDRKKFRHSIFSSHYFSNLINRDFIPIDDPSGISDKKYNIRIQIPLNSISIKKTKKCIVMLLSDSHSSANQNISKKCIHVDIESNVKRDEIYFTILLFQEALNRNLIKQNIWNQIYTEGNIQYVKDLLYSSMKSKDSYYMLSLDI